jgi:hypothetical protein
MFVRVVIFVDGAYVPAPISRREPARQAPGLAYGAINSPSGGRKHEPGRLCQAESRRMQT